MKRFEVKQLAFQPIKASLKASFAVLTLLLTALSLGLVGGAGAQTLQNFDSQTTGQQATGWVTTTGTWAVGTVASNSAPNSYGSTSNADGDSALYTANTAANSNFIRFNTNNNAAGSALGAELCMSADGSNGYVLNANPAGQAQIYRKTNGAFTQIATGPIPAFSGRSLVHAWRSGNNLNIDCYAAGTAEPTPLTVADTTYMSGYAGLRLATGSNGVPMSADDLTVGPGNDVSPLAAAAPSLTAFSPTTATLTGAAATGGTAPYTYQWFRSTVSQAATGTAISGATSVSLSDTGLTPSMVYYYRRVTTDSAGSLVTSAQVPVFTPSKSYIVGTVGDSITSGTGSSSVGVTNAGALLGPRLSKALNYQVIVNDQGASGAQTSDWLPSSTTQETGNNLGGSNVSGAVINAVPTSGGSPSTNVYALAKAGFKSTGVNLIQIMLGVNDSKVGNAVTVSTYLSQITTLIAQFKTDFPNVPIVVIPPSYVVPGSGGGIWNEQSDMLLQGYGVGLASLAGPGVTLGSSPFSFFANNPSESGDGVHPNDVGHSDLAAIWAASDLPIINPTSAPSAYLVPTITHNTSGQPVLTWAADSSATGYLVLRSVDNRVSYQTVATVGTSTLTYTDTTRPASGTVYYHVVSTH